MISTFQIRRVGARKPSEAHTEPVATLPAPPFGRRIVAHDLHLLGAARRTIVEPGAFE
jgi:hypothetical protein